MIFDMTRRTSGGGGGGYTADDWLDQSKPTGAITSDSLISASADWNYILFKHTGITSIHLTGATTTPSYFADHCTSLLTFVSEKAGGTMNGYCLGNCPALTAIDMGGATMTIGNDAIRASYPTTIILRQTTIPTLNANGFRGSSVVNNSYNVTFYIPKSLYDHLGDNSSLDYEAASNWSTIAARSNVTFAQIEGSYYETHWADGVAKS